MRRKNGTARLGSWRARDRDGSPRSGPILATKTFWFSADHLPSIVEMLWSKHLVLANELQYKHLCTGYSSPSYPRMRYKFERYWQHSEAQCTEGWIPFAKCVQHDPVTGVYSWKAVYSNPTKPAADKICVEVEVEETPNEAAIH